MRCKGNIPFLIFCLSAISIQYIHSVDDFKKVKIVPKSIDHTSIEWCGDYGLARNKEKGLKVYVYKIDDDFSLFGIGRKINAKLFIHDKKAANKDDKYRIEYWTAEGHAFMYPSEDYPYSKKSYYMYQTEYDHALDKTLKKRK